jgi:hypothetical protein
VEDRENGRVTIRSLSIPLDVEINLRKRNSRYFIEGPGLRELKRNARLRYHALGLATEKALQPDIYTRLARVPLVATVMGPLQSVLSGLRMDREVTPRDVASSKSGVPRVENVIRFLVDVDYARQSGELVSPGPKFAKAEREYGQSGDFIFRVMGDLLYHYHGHMTDAFGWRMMVPYLRWSGAYYWKAYEAGRLPVLNRPDWATSYANLYGGRTHGSVYSQIQSLLMARVVDQRKEGYIGVEEVYEPFAKKIANDPIVQSVLEASGPALA